MGNMPFGDIDMIRFSTSHEWVRLQGTLATVGITHYAQEELGPIVYIALPEIGTHVRAGHEIAVLESSKAAADLYTPVSGKILAINPSLRINPALVNQHAESEGWLFQIELSHPEEFSLLLLATEYQKLIGL